jgi:site-specific DNA-methyltransferase (adenine-specific)
MHRVGERVQAVVTDPPYNLSSIVKRFGKSGSAAAKSNGATGVYNRYSRGFMGQRWDNEVAFEPETWETVLDVMESGAHLAAFGGRSTYHRMMTAIEDAGFEIRDTLMWLYGSAMPHSKDLRKMTADEELDGFGTALKPAWEPIVLARKPIEGTLAFNALVYGTGGLNIDGARLHSADAPGRWPANVIHDGSPEVLEALATFGQKGGLAPVKGSEASEPTKNVYGKYGRVSGQFYGDTGTAARFFPCCPWSEDETTLRIHYSGKASPKDRAGSGHPTIKPIALMRWLSKLITPKNGLILDPFSGSGTTGSAALAEGFDAVLIEQSDVYVGDIQRRLAGQRAVTQAGPWEPGVDAALARNRAARAALGD